MGRRPDNISKSNCIINSENYFSPFVEPEFSFVMKKELDISKAPYKPEIICEFIFAGTTIFFCLQIIESSCLFAPMIAAIEPLFFLFALLISFALTFIIFNASTKLKTLAE